MALLVLAGDIQLWQIILLYFVFGALLAIDHPARRAFLVELVDEDELANAVALNATVFNLSSLIGYALAGVLIAAVGVGATMMFNSMTYVAPIVALLLIRVPDVVADRRLGGGSAGTPFRQAIWEGMVALMRQPHILGVMSLMAVVGGLAFPVFGMMPAFAEEVVQAGSIGLGLLLAAGALGSVLGTVAVAKLGVRRRGRTLTVASIALPLAVLVFGFTTSLWLACMLLVVIGLALLVLQSLAITLVQVQTDNAVRGRVMTVYSQLHAGADTMSNVAVGSMAVYTGLPAALALGAAISLVYAVGLRLALPAVSRMNSARGSGSCDAAFTANSNTDTVCRAESGIHGQGARSATLSRRVTELSGRDDVLPCGFRAHCAVRAAEDAARGRARRTPA